MLNLKIKSPDENPGRLKSNSYENQNKINVFVFLCAWVFFFIFNEKKFWLL